MAVRIQDNGDLGAMFLREAQQVFSRQRRIDDRGLHVFLVNHEIGIVVEGGSHDFFEQHRRVRKGVTCINLPGPHAALR